MTDKKKYLYGPVPSRRLGRSIGIDIVPFKVCTLDCIYCQLGKTTERTVMRKDYGLIDPIVEELKRALAEGLEADFITIAGSGEPTLNLRLGELIEKIKSVTSIAVAVLTNGTLFDRKDVRADCAKADVVMPSLDAGDEETFQKINRPHPSINLEKIICGLCEFRKEFAGKIWLEVLLVNGINTGTEQIERINEAIERISPDKIHLNTAVRPAAEPYVKKMDPDKLQKIAEQLGPKCEVIADFAGTSEGHLPVEFTARAGTSYNNQRADDVLSMLKRRPCSLNDICAAMKMNPNEAIKYISELQRRKLIHSDNKEGVVFYKT
jgi:wyosine [tRNA(Phe)-imidazoG37] synthetase (radical SAM superfamily)